MSAIDLALQPVRDEMKMVASVAQVETWLLAAKAGDTLHYATRPFLPPGAPGAKRLRDLSDQGLVELKQKRSDLIVGEFCYFARRTARPIDDALQVAARTARAVLAVAASDVGDFAAGDLILPILARAAQFGRPCPTDKQLAQRARIQPERVQPGFDALRAARLIVVHAAPAPTLRRVTILETGAQTGLAA